MYPRIFLLALCLSAGARADTFTVLTPFDSGGGSLRAAMLNANSNPGPDTIAFNLPGTGPFTLTPASPLPELDGPTVIDGYTQPGALPNTLVNGSDAVILIQIDGSQAGDTDGLVLAGGGSLVRGVSVTRFERAGIRLEAPLDTQLGNNRIEGNFIGLEPDGVTAAGNFDGITTLGDTVGNLVGGPDPAQRNVISANENRGYLVSTSNNIVQNNYFGSDSQGRLDRGQGVAIILLCSGNFACNDNLFGGPGPQTGNVFAGNQSGVTLGGSLANIPVTGNIIQGNRFGVEAATPAVIGDSLTAIGLTEVADTLIDGNLIGGHAFGIVAGTGVTGTVITANAIGTDFTGGPDLGNDLVGIDLRNGATDSLIGGPDPADANFIAYNETGVNIAGADTLRHDVSGNRIWGHAGLGIDLAEDLQPGVTPNDPGDADDDTNRLQNFPVLTAFERDAGTDRVTGTLDSLPLTDFRIELFADSTCNASGHGEGRNFLLRFTAATNAAGRGDFQRLLPGLPPGTRYLAATATDPAGNTSEFSRCLGPLGTVAVPAGGSAGWLLLGALVLLSGLYMQPGFPGRPR